MIFELRTYSFKNVAAAEKYEAIWERHIISTASFGIKTHAVFRDQTDRKKVLALVSYPDGSDPEGISSQYMDSALFKEDMAGFDFNLFENVTTAILEPSPFSPLR